MLLQYRPLLWAKHVNNVYFDGQKTSSMRTLKKKTLATEKCLKKNSFVLFLPSTKAP